MAFVFFGGIAIGLAQLPIGKEYIKDKIVDQFNNEFKGELRAEKLTGFIPFRATLHNAEVYSPLDSEDPVLTLSSAEFSVNLWELLQNNIDVLSFHLQEPHATLSMVDEELKLASAFKQRESMDRGLTDVEPFFERFNIYAPSIRLSNGRLHIDQTVSFPSQFTIPDEFTITDINTELFIESITDQLFLDIERFEASFPIPEIGLLTMKGQLFHNGEVLELNAFEFSTSEAMAQLMAEVSPLNLFGNDVINQFTNASYRFNIQESAFSSAFIKNFYPPFPDYNQDLQLRFESQGTFSELFIDRFELFAGESSALLTGQLENINSADFQYGLQFENIVLQSNDAEWLAQYYMGEFNLARYETSIIRGDLHGTLQSIATDFEIESGAGSLVVDAEMSFSDRPDYEVLFIADSLDITPFSGDTLRTAILNGTFAAVGSGFDENATVNASASFGDSSFRTYQIKKALAELNYENQRLNFNLDIEESDASLISNGTVGFIDDYINLTIEGNVSQVDLARYLSETPYEFTQLSGRFSGNLQGSNLDDFYGRASIEMNDVVINEDTLRPHQLYFDLDSPDGDYRQLRFTSSFFDLEMSGDIIPSKLITMGNHWLLYVQDRIEDEFLLGEKWISLPVDENPVIDEDFEIELSSQIRLKDLALLRHYLPQTPDLSSSARASISLNSSFSNITISSNISDSKFRFKESEISELNSSFNGAFYHSDKIRESGRLDFQLSGKDFLINSVPFQNGNVSISLRDDSLMIEQEIETLFDNLTYRSSLSAFLQENQFQVQIDDLTIGSPEYTWKTQGIPKITYYADNKTEFQDFIIASETDYLEVNGIFSSSFDDSVQYTVRDFNLGRISELIGGRVQFSGIMNGEFETRALTQIPSIQGDLTVTNGRMNNRVIGDVSLKSAFNSDEDRFDTEVHVYTDPDKYGDYLEENNGIGNDLRLNGYFKIPDDVASDEDLYYFDADLQEIDMWIVTVIVPTVVIEMDGRASGSGFIRGNADYYDFDASFDIQDVRGVPIFTNVNYTIDGNLDFNRSEGLQFNDLTLSDNYGGTGTLFGTIDLLDFSPLNEFDLTLDLNNLQFINNPPDPDIPFSANLFGSGQVKLTGNNLDPLLRTTQTISLASNSKVSIPLREETEFEQGRRFIQFVNSFDLADTEITDRNGANGNDEENNENLTFIELFTMDVQFVANDPINVELIFDPVTNEFLNSTGTGQIRVLLEDQDVSMFGRYNIQGGEYQFVGGDILTRRFSLQEGGNISWQGDLENANLNVTAVYRARPDISVLLPTVTSFQRVPIELILQIGGTISAIENDFFFAVPSGIEGTVDPTLTTQINTLNQNEDEKVLQAFGILLTGNFLPSDQTQNLGFADNVTGTTALVNPLISSQIISPLLSNQINSLLTNDVVFDVDVNLTRNRIGGTTEGDQLGVDLDIALRLFDDRVILRREGQIAGQQTNIGDLGATYRINRIFSVTAFHRQDPTLATRSDTDTRQTQEMNGVGVEAQFQFNTWQSFRNSVANSIKRLFGIKEQEPEPEDLDSLAENK